MVCCNSWGHKESDRTERLNWTELNWTEWASGFLYFILFKPEICNEEFMFWATVSSLSCFCWLYTASPSLAAKNITSLISVLTIWWCPHVESRLVWSENGVCFDQCVLLTKLLVFALLHCVLQGQTCLLLQVSLDFLLLHSNLPWWKGHPFLMLVLGGLVSLQRTGQIQLIQR